VLQRHVLAKGLALSSTIDYRLKPLIERFGNRPVAEIKTADIDDFVADLKQPRGSTVWRVDGLHRRPSTGRWGFSVTCSTGQLAASTSIELHSAAGTEVLIRMELEDNKRRRRISESEEAALLAVASPHLRSMIIAALDTGMRRGEMLALRFGDIDWTRRMITLRGATTKSRRTRLVPIGTARLLAVLGWLRLDSEGEHKGDDVPVFSNEAGEALKTFKKAWVVAVLKAHGIDLAGARAPTRTSQRTVRSGFGTSTCTGTT
jgi:integrase